MSREEDITTTNSIKVLKSTGDWELLTEQKIALVISKAFSALKGSEKKSRHILNQILAFGSMSETKFNQILTKVILKFKDSAYESYNLAKTINFDLLFRIFSHLTKMISFISIRNTSIHKNLSISA